MRKWGKAKSKESDAPAAELANPFVSPHAVFSGSTSIGDQALSSTAAMPQSSLANKVVPDSESSNAQLKPSTVRQVDVVLGQIVSVLLRSPRHKTFSLGDFEWRILPGILNGQFRVVQAQQSDTVMPVGVALWANVSAAVDSRLSDLSTPLQLKPDEWRSGEIPWLVELVADAQVQQVLLKHLGENVFKGKGIKMRVQGADGKTQIGTFKSTA